MSRLNASFIRAALNASQNQRLDRKWQNDRFKLAPLKVAVSTMENLIHVIYVSSAAPDIPEHDTVKFLNEARRANRKNDVSGMMLYIGGSFLQLLEGEAPKVDIVCQTIFRDKRQMRMVLREPIPEREFPEWTMGFEALAPLEAARLLGEPLLFDSVSRVASIKSDSAKTLLSIIGRRRWQSDRSGMFRAIRRTTKAPTVS
jgi:Sensors of blue-light using FAD